MGHQEIRRLVRTMFLERDWSALAADVVLQDQAQERAFFGQADVAGQLDVFFAQAFSGIETTVEAVLANGRCAVIVFQFRGRQVGPLMGLPLTGRQVDVPMVLVCHLDGRRVQRVTLYYNAGTLLRQIGLGSP